MLSFGQSYARYAVGTSAGSVCLEAGGVLLGPVGHRNKHQSDPRFSIGAIDLGCFADIS